MDNHGYNQDRNKYSGRRDMVNLSAAYAGKMNAGGCLPYAGNLLWFICGQTALEAGLIRLEISRSGEETRMDLQFLGESRAEADMDGLALEIIRAAGEETDERIFLPQEVAEAVKILKTKLVNDAEDMAAIFTEIGIDFPEDLAQEIWTVLPMSDGALPISYASVNEGYSRSMKSQVSAFLEDIYTFCERAEKRWPSEKKPPVHLIGDIYRFYPLWLQIQDTFPEVEVKEGFYEDSGESMKEEGIRLLGSGEVKIYMTAPWNAGMDLMDEQGAEAPLWAFSEGERIIPEEIRFLKGTDRDRTVPAPVWFEKGMPVRIVLRSVQEGDKSFPVEAGPIDNEENDDFFSTVGFSLDMEGRLFLHLRKFDLMKGRMSERDKKLGPFLNLE